MNVCGGFARRSFFMNVKRRMPGEVAPDPDALGRRHHKFNGRSRAKITSAAGTSMCGGVVVLLRNWRDDNAGQYREATDSTCWLDAGRAARIHNRSIPHPFHRLARSHSEQARA